MAEKLENKELTLDGLLKHISHKSFFGFYVFHGDEIGLMKTYIEQMSKASGKEIKWCDSIQEVIARAGRNTLIPESYIYLVQDDKSLFSNKNAPKLLRGIKTNIIISIYTKINKTSKLYKDHKDQFVPFSSLPAEILYNTLISKRINLNKNNGIRLAEVCQCSYSLICNEIDKINTYIDFCKSNGDNINADEAFLLCLSGGAIYQPIGDITFQLVDAIVARQDPRKMERLLLQAKLIQEPPLLTLSLLYNRYRNLMIYSGLQDKENNVEKQTGFTFHEVRSCAYNSKKYEFDELIDIVKGIQELEYGIKTGGIKEEYALNYFIAKYI